MKYDTALREYVHAKIAEIGDRDLVVGIPTYNSEATVVHVVKTVAEGLMKHYPTVKSAIMISDGGSLDYTRERVQRLKMPDDIRKIVFIYRGLPGKGTSLRAVFEAAVRLRARACAVFDSDLQSITPDWVKSLLDPVLSSGHDFVSPYYIRHKYDGTITNNIAYSLTRALYGWRVRQPIGGDFGFSSRLAQYFTKDYVWESDIARFGIDIWMTTTALCEGFKICEAHLGAKIHDPKDPAVSLGPMFRQVVGTIFALMVKYESVWPNVTGSRAVPLIGNPSSQEPPLVEIDLARLIESARTGAQHFAGMWKEILAPENWKMWEASLKSESPNVPHDLWAKTVYDFASAYRAWKQDRGTLINVMLPLYFGRIASFVRETEEMSSEESEAVVDGQSLVFENLKPYLIERYHRTRTLLPKESS